MTGTGDVKPARHGKAGRRWSRPGREVTGEEGEASSGEGTDGGNEPPAEWPAGYVPV